MDPEEIYQFAKSKAEDHISLMQRRKETHSELAINALLAMIESLHAEIQELKKAGSYD